MSEAPAQPAGDVHGLAWRKMIEAALPPAREHYLQRLDVVGAKFNLFSRDDEFIGGPRGSGAPNWNWARRLMALPAMIDSETAASRKPAGA